MWMEHYHITKTVRYPVINPFLSHLKEEGFYKVQIKENSQMGKVIGYAQYKLRHPRNRTIIVVGRGVAKTKVLNCVQILLSKNKSLHRCDASAYEITEDIWTPIDPESNLDSLSGKKHVPVHYVLLTKDELPVSLKSHPQYVQLKSQKRPVKT